MGARCAESPDGPQPAAAAAVGSRLLPRGQRTGRRRPRPPWIACMARRGRSIGSAATSSRSVRSSAGATVRVILTGPAVRLGATEPSRRSAPADSGRGADGGRATDRPGRRWSPRRPKGRSGRGIAERPDGWDLLLYGERRLVAHNSRFAAVFGVANGVRRQGAATRRVGAPAGNAPCSMHSPICRLRSRAGPPECARTGR
jgi:hypothetical protein